MATRTISIALAVEGQADYKKAMAEANRSLKEFNSELKLWQAEFRGQEDSYEGLTEKGKILTAQYDEQAKKVELCQAAMENAKKAVEEWTKKQETAAKAVEEASKKMAAMEEAGEKGSRAYEQLSAEQEKLGKELDNAASYLEAAERGVSGWKIQLNDAKASLADMDSALEENARRLSGEYSTTIKEAKEETENLEETAASFGDSFRNSMDAVEAAAAAFGVGEGFREVVETMQACIDKSIEFESAMTGVYKTVDLSLEEEERLAQDIRDMATEIPVSTTEIAGVAELAGQLGISNEALLDFTQTMVKLGTATNLTAEEAATSLAKLSNITGMAEENYGRLGSAIVDLGNHFATTEADIVNMTTRIASTGEVVGLTEPEMLALATALSSVGVEAEAGGTAISKLLKDMETRVAGFESASAAVERYGVAVESLDDGSDGACDAIQRAAEAAGASAKVVETLGEKFDHLREYAKVAGMSASEFAQLWRTDAVTAVDAFVTGLAKMDEQGGNSVATLEELGITEVRLSNAVLALGSSEGILSDALRVANNAWENNTALSEEASRRFETTESKVQLLKNAFDDLLISLGDDFKTAAEPIIEALTDLTRNMAGAAEESPLLASGLAGIGGALGGLTALTTVAGGIKLVVEALSLFGPAAGGIAAAVTAIAGLGSALYVYWENATEISKETERLTATNEALTQSSVDAREAFENTTATLEVNENRVRDLLSALENLMVQSGKTAAEEEAIQNIVKELNELLPGLGLSYDALTDSVNRTKEVMEEFANETANQKELSAYAERVGELTTKEASLQTAEEETGKQLAAARESYKNAKESAEEYYEAHKGLDRVTHIGGIIEMEQDVARAKKEVDALTESQEALGEELSTVRDELATAKEAYHGLSEEVEATNSRISEANRLLAENEANLKAKLEQIESDYAVEYEKTLETQKDALEDYKEKQKQDLEDEKERWEDRLETLRKNNEEELENLRETHEAEREDLQDTLDEELDMLEESHKEKLRLIDAEYEAKLKLLDEEEYNEIKRYQDQIDQLDAITEAENKAEQERQEQKKIAAAQEKIQKAKTLEELFKAQEDYNELIAQLDRKHAKERREEQKDELKEQIELVKASYKEREEALKEERDRLVEEENEAYQKEQETKREIYQDTLKQMNKDYEEHLKEVKEQQAQALKDEQKNRDEALEDYKKHQETQLELYKSLQEAQLDELKKGYENQKKEAEKHAEDMRDAIEQALSGFAKDALELGREAGKNYLAGMLEEIRSSSDASSGFSSDFPSDLWPTYPWRYAGGSSLFSAYSLAEGQIAAVRVALDPQTASALRAMEEKTALFAGGETALRSNLAGDGEGGTEQGTGKIGNLDTPVALLAAEEAFASDIQQARGGGGFSRSGDGVVRPIEITVISQLDGRVLSREVSRVQYRDAALARRTKG